MNKIFSRKGVLVKSLSVWSALATLATTSAPAFAAGTAVLGGSAELANLTRVTMDKNEANAAVFSSADASGVLDWTKFNVGSGQSMSFETAVGTTFFNLVDGAAGKSKIDGIINGSGNVWVINPAGIAFGAGSSVNVGGLFAAAAGNISNVDALRDGTSVAPEFSSFAGSVDVQGATFTGDRVALLGQKVAVDGGKLQDVGHLAIGAGNGMTVVDDVASGKVTINVTDFAVDPQTVGVELGDLELGGGVDIGLGVPVADRGLYVRSGNGIAVSGQVNTDGNAEFYTKNGDICVTEAGAVNANGAMSFVNLVAGMDGAGKGDVVVDGDVIADLGFGLGSVTAYAGYGVGGTGAEAGDVRISGTVAAGDAVDVQSFAGDVTVANGGMVGSLYSTAKIAAAGAVTVDGSVSGASGVDVYAYGKGVAVGEAGVVEAAGNGGQVRVVSAWDDGSSGDVTVKGSVQAVDEGIVWIDAGYGSGAQGSVTVDGVAQATSVMEIDAAGDVTGIGAVGAAEAQLDIVAGGKIELTGTVKGAETTLKAGGDIKAANTGNDFTDKLTAEGASVIVKDADSLKLGDVTAHAGDVQISTQSGDITVAAGKTVQTLAEGGTVALLAGREDYAGVDGNVVVNGSVKADVKDGTVALYGGNGFFSTGGVTVNGTVSAVAEGDAKASSVDIVSGFGMLSSGDVVVSQGGKVVSDGTVNVDAGYGEGYGYMAESSGNVVVNGAVKGESGVMLVSEDGNVSGEGTIDAGAATFEATAYTGNLDLGQVDIKAGDADFGAAGAITANCAENDFAGTVTAEGLSVKIGDANDVTFGDVSAYGGEVALMALDGKLAVDGAVSGVSSVKVYTGSGDVVVGSAGAVSAEAADGSVDITAGVSKPGKGKVTVEGSVSAASVVLLDGADGVVGAGTIDATGGYLNISGNRGSVTLAGQVLAKDVAFSADGDVEMANVQNDFTGIFSGSGKSVAVKDANTLKLHDVTATGGDIAFSTQAGDITVAAGKTVQTLAEGGTVALLAGREDYAGVDGSVVVNGSVKADVKGGSVALYGGNGHLSTGGVTINGSVSAVADGAEAASSVDIVSGFGMGASGDIEVSDLGSVVSDGEVNFSAGYGYGYGLALGSHGDISVSGKTIGGSKVALATSSGDVEIGASGFVASTGANGLAIVAAAQDDGSVGDVIIDGTVESIGKGGQTLVAAGSGDDSASGIYIAGLVSANGNVVVDSEDFVAQARGSLISADTGDVLATAANDLAVNGTVSASKTASLSSGRSAVQVFEHGYVQGGESVELDGKLGIDNFGIIDATDATLRADGHDGAVDLSAVNEVGVQGVVLAEDAYLSSSVMVAANNPLNEIKGCVEVQAPVAIFSAIGSLTLGDLASQSGIEMYLSSGDINVKGDVSAADSITLITDVGSISVDKGASLVATGAGSSIDIAAGVASTDDGGLVLSGGGVTVAGALSADSIQVYSCDSLDFSGRVRAEDVSLASFKDVHLSGSVGAGSAHVEAYRNLLVSGSISAGGDVTTVVGGEIDVSGSVSAGGSAELQADGNLSVRGAVSGSVIAQLHSRQGAVDVRGSLSSDNFSYIAARDGVSVAGTVAAKNDVMVESDAGNVLVAGDVVAFGDAGNAMVWAHGGDVRFTSTGSLRGSQMAGVVAYGKVTQDDGWLPSAVNGYEDVYSLRPAISGREVSFQVNGSVGDGPNDFVVVDGKVYCLAFGDVSIAAANGRGLVGGDASSLVSVDDTIRYMVESTKRLLDGTLTFEEALARVNASADFDDNGMVYAAGNMHVYTDGLLDANGLFYSGGDMTVAAATFGDMSYLLSDGLLTINNVGHPAHPQIAYFESVYGVEPKINNQPNDMVIFVDGRLAGGNLNILNKFGADEAFMVETPELKSTQGIFGNPPFLHSDLDVANPMEVSAIDYLIQEVPRLTLSSDFPAEVDQNVEAIGLSQKDVYWFGHKGSDGKKADDVQPPEDTVETEEGKEPPAEKKVAMAN